MQHSLRGGEEKLHSIPTFLASLQQLSGATLALSSISFRPEESEGTNTFATSANSTTEEAALLPVPLWPHLPPHFNLTSRKERIRLPP